MMRMNEQRNAHRRVMVIIIVVSLLAIFGMSQSKGDIIPPGASSTTLYDCGTQAVWTRNAPNQEWVYVRPWTDGEKALSRCTSPAVLPLQPPVVEVDHSDEIALIVLGLLVVILVGGVYLGERRK